jgi:hypothetical protein
LLKDAIDSTYYFYKELMTMELHIRRERAGYDTGNFSRLAHYRATLVQHLWEQTGTGQHVGIARRREVIFAADNSNRVCWIRKVV